MLPRGTKKTGKPSFVASHDSATALVMALGDFLTSSLAEEIRTISGEKNIRRLTISFDHPQDLSAPVADLYRWWWAARS